MNDKTSCLSPKNTEQIKRNENEDSYGKEEYNEHENDAIIRSRDKAVACKFAIEQYYDNFFHYLGQREARLNLLQQKLNEKNISPQNTETFLNDLAKKETEFIKFRRLRLTHNEFENIKLIGRGAFGEVRLVKMKGTGELFALKRLKKNDILKKDQVTHVRAERDIMAQNYQQNPKSWCVKLFFAFQDENYLYLTMEYVPGGDLMNLLIKWDTFTEAQTRFYIAETALAINSIHKIGYIHRDIKPDNLLLDKNGHVKLSDFGLCTGLETNRFAQLYETLSGKSTKLRKEDEMGLSREKRRATWKAKCRVLAFTTVGTPDYIAPEVFKNNGYTDQCDWWSVGCIMYEMLIGFPPFCSDTPAETYRKIMNWQKTLDFPPDAEISEAAKDLITHLLCGEDRYGFEEIKSHKFFKNFDWNHVREMIPPFIPRIDYPEDTRNFDEFEENEDDDQTIAKSKSILNPFDQRNIPFIGYTYKSFDAIKSSLPTLRAWSQFSH